MTLKTNQEKILTKIEILNHNLVNERIDKFLFNFFVKSNFENFSRQQIIKLLNEEKILVNNKICKPSYLIKLKDEIIIFDIPAFDFHELIIPTKIPIDIVYEDNDLMIINKQNHLVVHPGPGHWNDTLLNGLLYLKKQLSNVNSKARWGIVHRIDKDTTGLLIVAKNNKTHKLLVEQLKNHLIKRSYYAICHYPLKEKAGKIIAPIGRDPNNRLRMKITNNNSKEAITHFFAIKKMLNYNYIKCELETGRTHQIRVHMQYIKHPVVGDHIYGISSDKEINFGQFLHAYRLEFKHPITDKLMLFKAKLPEEFQAKLIEIENQKKDE